MSQRQAVTKARARAYARADRVKKTAILDELVELTGWHRDYARSALRDALKLKVVKQRQPRGPTYGPRIIVALIKCWAVLRAPAGKRLAPMPPDADRLLICADGGGSNGYRIRAWKIELAKLAAQTGLDITVCHLPPGTSKWNQIEHRLFSQITMNWRGRPLITHQVIVELIGATTTSTGLSVHCVLDTDHYPTGIRYEAAEVEALPLTRHEFHGEWNYTLHPNDTP